MSLFKIIQVVPFKIFFLNSFIKQKLPETPDKARYRTDRYDILAKIELYTTTLSPLFLNSEKFGGQPWERKREGWWE